MTGRWTPPAWTVTAVVAALAMVGPFTIDTIFPGFVSLGRDFDAEPAVLQQVTSVYLLSFAAMSVLHGPLSDALGRKPVMLAGLAGYVVASVLCALAPTLGWLLVGRGIQGVFAGAATVVSRAVIRDLYSGATAQRLMSEVMMIFAIAPAMAPIIGGWLLQLGTWPVIFWFVGGYALVVAVVMMLVLPETLDPADRVPLRIGPVLAGLWAVGRSWTFGRLTVAMVMTFGAYIFYVLAAPIIVVDLLGLGEQDFWVLFVPLVGGMVVGSWISGRMAGRVTGPVLVDRTMVLVLVAASLNVGVAALAAQLPWVLVGPTLLGTAIGMAFPVLQLALLDLFPHRIGSAASMSAFAVLISNAALAGLLAPVVTTSLLTAALASGTLSLGGALLWWWHRTSTAPVTHAPQQS